MVRKKQFSLTIHRDTAKEIIKYRNGLGLTNDETVRLMINISKPALLVLILLNKVFKWR